MTVFQKYRQQFNAWAVRIVCLSWAFVAVLGLVWVPQATADSIGVDSEKAVAIMRDRAANELDRMAGAGTSDFIEGSAQGSVGKAKRSLGRLTDDIDTSLDGATDQLKGKVTRDVGRLKAKAADISSDLEEATEDAADAVKDLLD